MTKPIRLSGHAHEQLRYRGCTEDEIRQTIMTSAWQPAEGKRFECRKNFIYNKEWNKKIYSTKQIRPIFVEDENEVVVVTVTTKHLTEGISADYDADGSLVGIEILDAIKRLGDRETFKKIVLEDIALQRAQ